MNDIKNPKAPGNDRGFTLIELLVAGTVFVIAVGALLGMLGRNEKAREMSYHVLESRQNARTGMEFIIGDVRMAGSGIPTRVVTSTASGDSMVLFAVTPDTTGSNLDSLRILAATSGVETKTRTQTLSATDVFEVVSTDSLNIGDLVVITHGAWANLFQLTHVNDGTLELEHNVTSPFNLASGHGIWPPGGYPPGSDLYQIDLITYYIDRSDTTCPLLMRRVGTDTPAVISEYIDEVQFEYVLVDQSVVTIPPDPSLIRRVIITVEAFSAEESRQHVTRLISSAKPRTL